MKHEDYSAPVDTLLTYGSARDIRDWSRYMECGFTHAHIPELITMLTDEDLWYAESTSDEVWAPIHAWRVLSQLDAVDAIPALLDQLYRIDDDGNDWVGEEFPDVFTMIGAPAIPRITEYLAEAEHGLFARVCTAHSLANIGKRHPDTRQTCIKSLETQLRQHSHNDPTLNGFLVSFLLDLKALEALHSIQAAYHDSCVDLSITGDCEDAEIELGVRETRTTPRPHFGFYGVSEVLQHSAPVRKSKKKIGRNDPCPCGSGKKYKKCCLNK